MNEDQRLRKMRIPKDRDDLFGFWVIKEEERFQLSALRHILDNFGESFRLLKKYCSIMEDALEEHERLRKALNSDD